MCVLIRFLDCVGARYVRLGLTNYLNTLFTTQIPELCHQLSPRAASRPPPGCLACLCAASGSVFLPLLVILLPDWFDSAGKQSTGDPKLMVEESLAGVVVFLEVGELAVLEALIGGVLLMMGKTVGIYIHKPRDEVGLWTVAS